MSSKDVRGVVMSDDDGEDDVDAPGLFRRCCDEGIAMLTVVCRS